MHAISRKFSNLGVDGVRKNDRLAIILKNSSRNPQSLRSCVFVITLVDLDNVDDPTVNDFSCIWRLTLEYRPELWDQIQACALLANGRTASENNRRRHTFPW